MMDNNTNNIFDTLLKIFDKLFNGIENKMFYVANSLFLGEFIAAISTLAIIFWAAKLIRQGDFKVPENMIDIIVFFLFIAFINYSLSNKDFLDEIVSYLDIPANTIQNFIFQILNEENLTLGGHIEEVFNRIFDNYSIFVPEISLLKINANLFLSLLLWLIYAYFSFILATSIIVTIILNYLQVAFWKSFAVVILPLIYFKVTRQIVIFWLKTIIALTLISSFMLIVGGLSNQIENSLNNALDIIEDNDDRVSYLLLASFIVSKIICITFLKEIPSMINGMLQTGANANAGAFANSITMTSIGAGGATAAYGAFKGAISGGKLSGNVAQGLGKTVLETNTGSAIKTVGKNIGSNVSRGIVNLSSGNSWNHKK